MLVGISCGLAATLSFHLIVREQSRNNDDEIALATKSDSPIVKNPSLVSWLLNPKLYFVACVYMATRLFVNLTQSYIPFYLQNENEQNVRDKSDFFVDYARPQIVEFAHLTLC